MEKSSDRKLVKLYGNKIYLYFDLTRQLFLRCRHAGVRTNGDNSRDYILEMVKIFLT